MARIHQHEAVVTEETEHHEPFNVAKVAVFVVGAINVIIGIVGLARVGFDDLTQETASFAGMEMTGLLALFHVTLGALALTGAASTLAAKGALTTSGAILVIGGIIALIQPIEALGWNDTNGIVYLIIGALALVIGSIAVARVVERRSVDATY